MVRARLTGRPERTLPIKVHGHSTHCPWLCRRANLDLQGRATDGPGDVKGQGRGATNA